MEFRLADREGTKKEKSIRYIEILGMVLDIDKKKMKLEESIKTLGTYEVPVKLHKDVTAKLRVVVGESK